MNTNQFDNIQKYWNVLVESSEINDFTKSKSYHMGVLVKHRGGPIINHMYLRIRPGQNPKTCTKGA